MVLSELVIMIHNSHFRNTDEGHVCRTYGRRYLHLSAKLTWCLSYTTCNHSQSMDMSSQPWIYHTSPALYCYGAFSHIAFLCFWTLLICPICIGYFLNPLLTWLSVYLTRKIYEWYSARYNSYNSNQLYWSTGNVHWNWNIWDSPWSPDGVPEESWRSLCGVLVKSFHCVIW